MSSVNACCVDCNVVLASDAVQYFDGLFCTSAGRRYVLGQPGVDHANACCVDL